MVRQRGQRRHAGRGDARGWTAPSDLRGGCLRLTARAREFPFIRDRCTGAGIRVPIVPGILPITNFAQVQRITSLCKAILPAELCSALQQAGDDEDAQFAIGVDYATRQVQGLIDAGVPGLHFYVLNKSPATVRVLRAVNQ